MTPEVPDRLLRVDLSAGAVESEPIPGAWRRNYVGGKGLGARYLYEELDPGTDPLAPENPLLFMLGPLSGALPGEGRYAAVTKSPLTGTFLDSYSGGRFPGALRGSLGEHLGLLVSGRAEGPVRLVVSGGEARIEPADTWGADAAETCAAYDGVVACIGPAGENRVSYATIASDRTEHHAGRGGAGAVMGSKRLKAVVAEDDPPEVPAALAALNERDTEAFHGTDTGRWLAASGTLETVDFADEAGVLAARGWQERGFDGVDGIGVEAAREAASGRESDGDLPGDVRVDTPAGETVPRGATAMTLGAGLGLEEFDAAAELGERCNRLGVDLISAGNAVAWAIRAAEAGMIDRGVEFDDPEGARELLREVATRSTAVGDALAEGVAAAATRLGGTALVPTVKDMTLPAYDPRGAASMALAYATSDRGACHRRARPVEREVFEEWSPTETAAAVVEAQDARSIRWSLVADDFVGEVLADHGVAWLDAVGHPHDDDLRVTGERIWNLVRLFNVREGFDRTDDTLPAGLDTGGEDALDPETFEETLERYYAVRGWGADGRPSRGRLAELDLLGTVDEHTPIAEAPIDP
ncbi:MAG: aldehyde ferredoxin oxidoreductase C-terminal domain-containing protein [Haloarculaceae archaeon]